MRKRWQQRMKQTQTALTKLEESGLLPPEVLQLMQDSPGSPYHSVRAEHFRQLEAQRLETLKRQQAIAEETRRAVQEWQRQLAVAEAERQSRYKLHQELLTFIADCKRRRWIYPENGLLLGTVSGHPLERLSLKIPDFLHDECHDHRHITQLPVWFTGPEHGLTFGSTGSGKFTAMIANNVMLFGGSIFVIDPKGEICSVTAKARRDKHQKVCLLDPCGTAEFEPGSYRPPLASYNPLDALDPNDNKFHSDVARLVEILSTPHKGGGDAQFFVSQSKMLLTALIMFVCTNPHFEGARNLCKVYEFLCYDNAHKRALLQEMAEDTRKGIHLCATAHIDMAEKQRDGIWGQAQTDLNIFSWPEIEEVTKSSSFRLDDLFLGDCSVYLVLDNNSLDSHNQWLRLMVACSLMVAVRNRGKRQGRRMLWVIDEAKQIGVSSMIPRAYRLLRGYDVQMWTFWQTLQDLQTAYPDDWQSMIGNSFVQVMRCRDFDTAEYFSKLGGEYEEKKISIGHTDNSSWTTSSSFSVGQSGSGGVSHGPGGTTTNSSSGGSSTQTTGTSGTHGFSDTTTRSWQWERRIRPHEIQNMEQDKLYLYCDGEPAGFINKYEYHKDAVLNALASANPFFGGSKPEPLFARPELGRLLKRPDEKA